MHVDACLGGFLIVFMEGLGYELQGGEEDRTRIEVAKARTEPQNVDRRTRPKIRASRG